MANRLQAALWREAIHLVESGVTFVENVNKAVWAGSGLRRAVGGGTGLETGRPDHRNVESKRTR